MRLPRLNRTIVCMVMAILCAMTVHASLLPAPVPDRFVYDYAGVLGTDAQQINSTLVNFSKSTSNQIAVVTVKSLNGMEPAEFAYTLGDEWGVGSAGHDNGVIILIKPKTGDTPEAKGQVFIATGRGLEGAITDALCDQIVRKLMTPKLKENDYAGAVNAAAATLMDAARGEYNEQLLDDDEEGSAMPLLVLLLVVFGGIFVFALMGNIHPRNSTTAYGSRTMSSRGVIDWNGVMRDMGNITLSLLALVASGGSGGGSGRSGGGSSGHSFGGGSFGGGGAGGSW